MNFLLSKMTFKLTRDSVLSLRIIAKLVAANTDDSMQHLSDPEHRALHANVCQDGHADLDFAAVETPADGRLERTAPVLHAVDVRHLALLAKTRPQHDDDLLRVLPRLIVLPFAEDRNPIPSLPVAVDRAFSLPGLSSPHSGPGLQIVVCERETGRSARDPDRRRVDRA